MKNNPQLQQIDIAIWLALQMKFETLQVPQTTCRTFAVCQRDQDDPHDDAPPEGENSAKRQKTSEYEEHVTGESSGQIERILMQRSSYITREEPGRPKEVVYSNSKIISIYQDIKNDIEDIYLLIMNGKIKQGPTPRKGMDKIRLGPVLTSLTVYGTILPKELTNQAMLESKAYKTYYAFASGEKNPKPNEKRVLGCSLKGDDTNDDDKEDDMIRTELDIIKIHVLDQSTTEYYEEEEENIDDEETMDDDEDEDDEVTKELYEDVNVNLRNEDTEMVDADQGASEQRNVSQESGFEQVEEDAHVTITPVLDTQKADEPVQTRHATAVPEITSSFIKTIPPSPPFFNPLLQQATPTPTPTTSEATISFTSLLDFSSIFRFNDRVTNLEKDLLEIKQVDQQEAQDEKNAYIELIGTSMRVVIKEEVNTQLPQILPQAVSDFATPVIEKNVTESLEAAILARGVEMTETKIETPSWIQTKGFEKKEIRSQVTQFMTQECNKIKSSTYVTKMNNPLTRRLPRMTGSRNPNDFQLLILIGIRDNMLTPDLLRPGLVKLLILKNLDFFINNNLEYLKGGDLSRRYSTSVTKTKAATYEIKWSEDLVQNLWSPIKVIYDQHAYWGTSHWGPKRQHFYGFAANMTLTKDVYSRKRIIAITRLLIMKKYDYGQLGEIEVVEGGSDVHKFREGDLPRLRLQDIEDMLLLLVQQKLTNLTIDE
ncbi:hypothetical protein Tco_0488110 [Tanacetum coccineum]